MPYDSVEALMGLIVHRYECDSPYDSTGTLLTEESYTYNINVRSIYMDLDAMIAKTKLSAKQKYIIERIMLGFSMSDIAKEFACDKKDIMGILKSAAKRIQKTYHIDLITWLETSGNIKVRANARYKTCRICNRVLDVKYFTPNEFASDGYRNECKICRM